MINGFIEVYKDARGIKGAYEGIVYFRNEKETALMKKRPGSINIKRRSSNRRWRTSLTS